MEIQMLKQPDGVLVPFNAREQERLNRFRTGCLYPVEIRQLRNPEFHKKVFAFLNFCFQYWSGERTEWQFQSEAEQFDTFRKNLTVLAGYRHTTFTIDGRLRVEPKSLAFGNMTQEEFENCYNAMINAALTHVFAGEQDPKINDYLRSFF
jgi:hypothetical protein